MVHFHEAFHQKCFYLSIIRKTEISLTICFYILFFLLLDETFGSRTVVTVNEYENLHRSGVKKKNLKKSIKTTCRLR